MNGIAHTLLANSDAQAVNLALLMSALLFACGLVGFLSRRNMIIMFLCTEQGCREAADPPARPHRPPLPPPRDPRLRGVVRTEGSLSAGRATA